MIENSWQNSVLPGSAEFGAAVLSSRDELQCTAAFCCFFTGHWEQDTVLPRLPMASSNSYDSAISMSAAAGTGLAQDQVQPTSTLSWQDNSSSSPPPPTSCNRQSMSLFPAAFATNIYVQNRAQLAVFFLLASLVLLIMGSSAEQMKPFTENQDPLAKIIEFAGLHNMALCALNVGDLKKIRELVFMPHEDWQEHIERSGERLSGMLRRYARKAMGLSPDDGAEGLSQQAVEATGSHGVHQLRTTLQEFANSSCERWTKQTTRRCGQWTLPMTI